MTLKSLFFTAAFVLAAGVAAQASSPAQKINVSLEGEAGSMMAVTVTTSVVKAGPVEFDVINAAIGTDHEVILFKLTSKDQKIAVDPKTHRINEKTLKSLGEVSGLKPGASGVLKVNLTPGDYIFICNHKTHYEMGMYTPITVTK